MYIYKYIFKNTKTHTYICGIYMCMYIYVYIYTHTHMVSNTHLLQRQLILRSPSLSTSPSLSCTTPYCPPRYTHSYFSEQFLHLSIFLHSLTPSGELLIPVAHTHTGSFPLFLTHYHHLRHTSPSLYIT